MLPIVDLTLDSPATYQIVIKGYLDQSWADYVGDVTIRVQSQPDEPVVTVITGEFQDQAALAGACRTSMIWAFRCYRWRS